MNYWLTDLSAQADIIGLAAAPAIEFGDPQTAAAYLESLKGKPSIIAAAIYSPGGARFASYVAADERACCVSGASGGRRALAERERTRPVQADRRR